MTMKRLRHLRAGTTTQPRAAAALLASLAVVALAIPSLATAGQSEKQVSAHLVYVIPFQTTGCPWGIGVTFQTLPGAASYSITYWDNLSLHVVHKGKLHATVGWVTATVPASAITGANALPAGLIFSSKTKMTKPAAGSGFLGITGGNGSGPCDYSDHDPTEHGRFEERVIADAYFASPLGRQSHPGTRSARSCSSSQSTGIRRPHRCGTPAPAAGSRSRTETGSQPG